MWIMSFCNWPNGSIVPLQTCRMWVKIQNLKDQIGIFKNCDKNAIAEGKLLCFCKMASFKQARMDAAPGWCSLFIYFLKIISDHSNENNELIMCRHELNYFLTCSPRCANLPWEHQRRNKKRWTSFKICLKTGTSPWDYFQWQMSSICK